MTNIAEAQSSQQVLLEDVVFRSTLREVPFTSYFDAPIAHYKFPALSEDQKASLVYLSYIVPLELRNRVDSSSLSGAALPRSSPGKQLSLIVHINWPSRLDAYSLIHSWAKPYAWDLGG